MSRHHVMALHSLMMYPAYWADAADAVHWRNMSLIWPAVVLRKLRLSAAVTREWYLFFSAALFWLCFASEHSGRLTRLHGTIVFFWQERFKIYDRSNGLGRYVDCLSSHSPQTLIHSWCRRRCRHRLIPAFFHLVPLLTGSLSIIVLVDSSIHFCFAIMLINCHLMRPTYVLLSYSSCILVFVKKIFFGRGELLERKNWHCPLPRPHLLRGLRPLSLDPLALKSWRPLWMPWLWNWSLSLADRVVVDWRSQSQPSSEMQLFGSVWLAVCCLLTGWRGSQTVCVTCHQPPC